MTGIAGVTDTNQSQFHHGSSNLCHQLATNIMLQIITIIDTTQSTTMKILLRNADVCAKRFAAS